VFLGDKTHDRFRYPNRVFPIDSLVRALLVSGEQGRDKTIDTIGAHYFGSSFNAVSPERLRGGGEAQTDEISCATNLNLDERPTMLVSTCTGFA
jgi:hypothetical protein